MGTWSGSAKSCDKFKACSSQEERVLEWLILEVAQRRLPEHLGYGWSNCPSLWHVNTVWPTRCRFSLQEKITWSPQAMVSLVGVRAPPSTSFVFEQNASEVRKVDMRKRFLTRTTWMHDLHGEQEPTLDSSRFHIGDARSCFWRRRQNLTLNPMRNFDVSPENDCVSPNVKTASYIRMKSLAGECDLPTFQTQARMKQKTWHFHHCMPSWRSSSPNFDTWDLHHQWNIHCTCRWLGHLHRRVRRNGFVMQTAALLALHKLLQTQNEVECGKKDEST